MSENRLTIALAIALLGIRGAAGQTTQPQNVPKVVALCDILRDPLQFDKKEVVTSGVEGNSFHQSQFFDPECSLPKHGGVIRIRFDDSYKLGQPEDKKLQKMLRTEGAVHVEVRGYFVSTGGPFGPETSPYEYLVLQVLAVQKLSSEYRQRYSIGTGETNPNKE
jgi:hypothetical protein